MSWKICRILEKITKEINMNRNVRPVILLERKTKNESGTPKLINAEWSRLYRECKGSRMHTPVPIQIPDLITSRKIESVLCYETGHSGNRRRVWQSTWMNSSFQFPTLVCFRRALIAPETGITKFFFFVTLRNSRSVSKGLVISRESNWIYTFSYSRTRSFSFIFTSRSRL